MAEAILLVWGEQKANCGALGIFSVKSCLLRWSQKPLRSFRWMQTPERLCLSWEHVCGSSRSGAEVFCTGGLFSRLFRPTIKAHPSGGPGHLLHNQLHGPQYRLSGTT